MANLQNLILVAVIKSSHGIQGHVLIKSFTDPFDKIARIDLLNAQGQNINIRIIKRNSRGELICKFNEVSTRNEAENLKNYQIFCNRDNLLKPLAEDEFYITELKDLPVLNEKLEQIGFVKNIFNFGAGDIIEIEFLNQKTELLPFTKQFFPIITKDHVILNYICS